MITWYRLLACQLQQFCTARMFHAKWWFTVFCRHMIKLLNVFQLAECKRLLNCCTVSTCNVLFWLTFFLSLASGKHPCIVFSHLSLPRTLCALLCWWVYTTGYMQYYFWGQVWRALLHYPLLEFFATTAKSLFTYKFRLSVLFHGLFPYIETLMLVLAQSTRILFLILCLFSIAVSYACRLSRFSCKSK